MTSYFVYRMFEENIDTLILRHSISKLLLFFYADYIKIF